MLNLLLALAAFAGLSAQASPPAERYAEGQVWEYRTRAGEEGSLLRIQQIDEHPAEGRVYHISVAGVRIVGNDAVMPVLAHLPVSRATLDASVTRLSSRTAEFPDASQGIAHWRQGRGGAFTIPVAEIVAVAERTLREAIVGSPD